MKRFLTSFWIRRVLDRLGVRLALVLAVALLPLAIVSVLRSQAVLSENRARSEAALRGATLNAVSQEIALIQRAQGASTSLAAVVPEILPDQARCFGTMENLAEKRLYSFVGFIDTSGHSSCSSAGSTIDFGVTPELAELLKAPKPSVFVNEEAPVSGTSVFYTMSPAYDADGTLLGFASVSVPHSALVGVSSDAPDDVVFLTVSARGNVLTATDGLAVADNVLPKQVTWEEMLGGPPTMTALGRDNVLRTYAVVPVIDRELFAVGTWPEVSPRTSQFYLRNPMLFPALMWLASLGVAWFASELFVTRHVRALRGTMRAFADERRNVRPERFKTAPSELRAVVETYSDMTFQIMRDEALLEDTVRQKDILLREVHHRVKNNLQLIASIMDMQMRQTKSDQVRSVVKRLHDRIMGLATIHRGLYQTSGLADVEAGELLKDIVRQLVQLGSDDGQGVEVRFDVETLLLNPDQAVPLSLLVTEAVTNSLKYAGLTHKGEAYLKVTLHGVEDDQATLKIENSVAAKDSEAQTIDLSSGLGQQLLEAFAMQLGGTLESREVDGAFELMLIFPVEPLSAKPAI